MHRVVTIHNAIQPNTADCVRPQALLLGEVDHSFVGEGAANFTQYHPSVTSSGMGHVNHTAIVDQVGTLRFDPMLVHFFLGWAPHKCALPPYHPDPNRRQHFSRIGSIACHIHCKRTILLFQRALGHAPAPLLEGASLP